MTGKIAASLGVVLIGSALSIHGCGTPETRTDWRVREAHLETLGRVAAQVALKHVKESQGLRSDAGMRLLCVGARLNEISLRLVSKTTVDENLWEEIESIFDRRQSWTECKDEALMQAFLIVDELLPRSREDERARLWLGLFLTSFSHTLLEGFENELAL
jgi:hypothetical protein